MRVLFAGTPDFAAQALQAVVDAHHEVALVLTQPDRPSGRGMKLTPSPVKRLAESLGLKVATPRTLSLKKDPVGAAAMHECLASCHADLLIVAAYGLILPQPVLDCAKGIGIDGSIKALNIHASLLPRWRGAAPIARAIEAGDLETGVTLMKMELGLDTGPMVAEVRTPINAADTTESLTERLAKLGAQLLVDALERADSLTCTPQPEENVLYAEKLLKTEKHIHWEDNAAAIERRMRAFTPFPGLEFLRADVAVKVWKAQVSEGCSQARPGEVLSVGDSLIVQCGDGALGMSELQRPGKARGPASSVIQSLGIKVGDVLE